METEREREKVEGKVSAKLPACHCRYHWIRQLGEILLSSSLTFIMVPWYCLQEHTYVHSTYYYYSRDTHPGGPSLGHHQLLAS